jgi:predicted small secreted protein
MIKRVVFMKRVISIVLALALMPLFVSGCTTAAVQGQGGAGGLSAVDADQAPEPEAPVGTDYTIAVDSYVLEPDTVEPAVNSYSEASYLSPAQTVSDLDELSPLVVTGTVDSIEFFSNTGFAYIKVDFVIDNSIRGRLVPGDRISVVLLGGYISIQDHVDAFQNGFRFDNVPKEEWATTYICEGAPAWGFPEPGDKYAYFLAESTKFEKAYRAVQSDETIFKDDGSGRYTRINPFDGYIPPDGEEVIDSFTIDDLNRYFGK